MDNGKEIIKQILLIICIITLPPIIAWIFGAWGAIIMLVIILCLVAHYAFKYQG